MIFIPKKNIYFPNRKWGMKKFQRGILHPVGFWAPTGPALDTTIDIRSGIYDAHATSLGSEDALAYGYGDASAGNPVAVFINSLAAMGDDTYTDGSSISRQIDGIFWTDYGVSGTPAGETDNIYFGIKGTSVPDTNATFIDFTYNGVTYTRSGRDTYLSSEGTGNINTYWVWLNVVTDGPTSGAAITFVLTTS